MKNISSCFNKKGLTQLELIISLIIAVIFSIFMIDLTVTSRNAWEIGFTQVGVNSEIRNAIEQMKKELREARQSTVSIPSAPNNSQISFAVPLSFTNNTIASWKPIEYTWDSAQKQIVRTESGSNATVLARKVQSLSFTNPTGNIINIALATNDSTAGGRSLSVTLDAQIALRN